MTPVAHLSSGYLVYEYVLATTSAEGGLLFSVALAGSMAPDIDGLFGSKMKDHRSTVFHSPLIWLALYAGLHLTSLTVIPNATPYVTAFFLAAFAHHLLDWFAARTGGVRLLYPFSKKTHSFFPLQPERGGVPVWPKKDSMKEWIDFWKFYFSNKFLIGAELFVVVSSIFVYGSTR